MLRLLQALIDTIEDDYAEVLERYWIAEAHRMHDQAMTIEYDLEDGDDDEGRPFTLDLTKPDDF